MKKIILLLAFILLLPNIVYAGELELAPKAKSAILIEVSTGEVLYEKNAHERLAPASMTKMMSMILIYEDILSGGMTWDEKIQISDYAASMGGSQIFLEPNEVMTVEDLFKGVAIGSANDATVALAERVAGTNEAFVDMMNERVAEMGLENTNFVNATGLPAENHYSSAYDMAMIGKELANYEEILNYTKTYEDYLRQDSDEHFWLVNTNRLVRFYPGVDGIKTGYTNDAGYCLTATAKKNDMRVVTVVMGVDNSRTRSSEIAKMLDYAFQQYELDTLVGKDEVIGDIDVVKGKDERVELVPIKDVNLLHKRGTDKREVTYDYKVTNNNAPLKHGKEVGTLYVYEGDNVILEMPITVLNDVESANLFDLFKQYFVDVLSGK